MVLRRAFISYISIVVLLHQSQGLASRRSPRRKGSASGEGKGFGSTNALSTRIDTNKESQLAHSYTVDKNESCRRLLEFLEEEECEGVDVFEIGKDSKTGLRGVFAKEAINTGDYICAIPFVTTLLIDEKFLEDSNDEEARLSATRLDNGLSFLQKFVEDDTQSKKWKPYLDCLPINGDINFDATPDFWSEEEIRQLEVPSLVEDMLARKKDLERQAIQSEVDLTKLQHSAWVVRTRAFTTLKKAITLDGTEGFLQRTVLIPFLDLLNHDSFTPNAELQVVETKEYDESFYSLVATRPIKKGTEVRIKYGTGEETSLDLFAKYGFLPCDHQKTDKRLLPELLHGINWTTSLKQDESKYETATGIQRTILSLRCCLKKL